MRSRLAMLGVLSALLAAFMPAWAQAQDVGTLVEERSTMKIAGGGTARALDLTIPALSGLASQIKASTGSDVIAQAAKNFPGLTVGMTEASFTSTIESLTSNGQVSNEFDATVSGSAVAQCELFSGENLTTGLPCANDHVKVSEASARGLTSQGGKQLECKKTVALTLLSIAEACSRSYSGLTSGLPAAANEAGVALVRLSLDLTDYGLTSFLEDEKDFAVLILRNVLAPVFQITNSQQQLSQLDSSLNDFLTSVANGGESLVIKAGNSTTDITSTDETVKVLSRSAGARIGFFGIKDALSDGLLMIEVSAAKAEGVLNLDSSIGSAKATPALATIYARDLLNLCGGRTLDVTCDATNGYVVAQVTVNEVNGLLAPLKGTLLETTVTPAGEAQTAEGKQVAVSTDGIFIHALKGLGSSGKLADGSPNGGVMLRVASAAVSLSGDEGFNRVFVSSCPVGGKDCALPLTGGNTPGYLWGAFALAVLSLPLMFWARRLLRLQSDQAA